MSFDIPVCGSFLYPGGIPWAAGGAGTELTEAAGPGLSRAGVLNAFQAEPPVLLQLCSPALLGLEGLGRVQPLGLSLFCVFCVEPNQVSKYSWIQKSLEM